MKKLICVLLICSVHYQLFCNNIELYIKENTIVKGIEHFVYKQNRKDTVFVLNNTILISKENFIIKNVKIDTTRLIHNIIISKEKRQILKKKLTKSHVTSLAHYLSISSSLKNLLSSSNPFPNFFINNFFNYNLKKTTNLFAKFIGNFIQKNIKSIFFVNFYNKPPPPFF